MSAPQGKAEESARDMQPIGPAAAVLVQVLPCLAAGGDLIVFADQVSSSTTGAAI
jgi:hypothetical protein